MSVVGSVQRMLRSSAVPAASRRPLLLAKQGGSDTLGPVAALVRTAGVRGTRVGGGRVAVSWGRGGRAAPFQSSAVAGWKVGDPQDPTGHLCGSKEGDKTDVHEEHPEIYHHTDTHMEDPIVKHDLDGAAEPTEGFIREFYKGKTVRLTSPSHVTPQPLFVPCSPPARLRVAEPPLAAPITRPFEVRCAPSYTTVPSFRVREQGTC